MLCLCFGLLFGFVFLFPCASVDAREPALNLSLSKVVDLALRNNVSLQIQKETIHLNQSTLHFEAAQFDPSFSLNLSADGNIRSSPSLIETGPSGTTQILQENQSLTTRLTQPLRWGGSLDLSVGQYRSRASYQAFNPSYRGDLMLSFTKPLWQNAGRALNEGNIRIAATDIKVSEHVFRASVSSILLELSTRYWILVFQRKNETVQQQTLASAEKLLFSSRAKVELGVIPPIEILVAESGVASRKEAVFIAQKEIADSEDLLRQLMNVPEQFQAFPPEIVPSDEAGEDLGEPANLTVLLSLALEKRSELAQNTLVLEKQQVLTALAKDKLSPTLDFVGRLGLSGLGRNVSGEGGQLGSGDFRRWEAGFELSFPLGQHAARAKLAKERINMKKIRFAQQETAQKIVFETKEGFRRVQTNVRRIEVTRQARKLAEDQLAAGNARYNLGLINVQDILIFQDDLAQAQQAELKAIVDFRISQVNLKHVTGMLLEDYHIETGRLK